jgi:hypothetical protein
VVEGKQQHQQQATAAAAGLTSQFPTHCTPRPREGESVRERLQGSGGWDWDWDWDFDAPPSGLVCLLAAVSNQQRPISLTPAPDRPCLCPQRLGLVGPTQRRRSQPALPACCWRGGGRIARFSSSARITQRADERRSQGTFTNQMPLSRGPHHPQCGTTFRGVTSWHGGLVFFFSVGCCWTCAESSAKRRAEPPSCLGGLGGGRDGSMAFELRRTKERCLFSR